jgi:hypothetical protein
MRRTKRGWVLVDPSRVRVFLTQGASVSSVISEIQRRSVLDTRWTRLFEEEILVVRRSVRVGRPWDGNRRIELVAAIAFGHDALDPDRAVRGWQTTLSKAMGMGRTGVSDTLQAEAEVFSIGSCRHS